MLGATNPVAGPYFNFTIPEPTGVVAIVAPDEPPLLGLVSRIAPALVGGNAVVALASETQPLAAIELAEAIATSDVPGGVVNLLTGHRAELAPWLASHMDVNAIDLTGADGLGADLERAAADNVKRVVRAEPDAQSLVRDLGVPRAEDRLAPDRRHERVRRRARDRAAADLGRRGRPLRRTARRRRSRRSTLEPNIEVPEHSHVNEQIGVLIRGSVTFRIGDEAKELQPGATWVIPADVPHSVDAGAGRRSIVELFAPPRADWAGLERLEPGAPTGF